HHPRQQRPELGRHRHRQPPRRRRQPRSPGPGPHRRPPPRPHRRSRPPLRKKRRAQGSPGATSTSSSADYRGVAHLRYALRTRGGCSYQATIPEGATVSGNAARMATPGRDEHQLVRGLPGCSACTTPFAPGAGAPTKLRFPRARRFPETRRAWQRLGGTSTSSSADYRCVAHLRYALRTRGGCSYKAGGAVLLAAGNPSAAVYPRVALEVLVQGLGGDILDLVLLLQCRVQLEAAEVVGEIQ